MADFSLIPERQLLFSPQLAATIGLEEAILLQHLQQSFDHHEAQVRRGYAWLRIERAYLQRTLPFWSVEDLHRISRNLADKGVILLESAPLLTTDHLLFAVNEQVQPFTKDLAAPAAALAEPVRRSAGLLPIHWSPSEDLLQLLALNHNIPRQFALGQVEDFVFYWRERGEPSHAWENKFRQQVLTAWRRQQQHQAAPFQVAETTGLDNNWRPSVDALEIMERRGIDRDFIEQAVPEFILYWRERGINPKELNSRFIQHIRLQWARFSSGLEHSTEPRRITERWQPAEDVFDILRLSHIDIDFARSLLPEFIVYWRDSNQAHTSWNSKYLQHVKHHWAKRHQINQAGTSYDGQQGTNRTGRPKDRSLEDHLTDTSWAD
jgi:hypothetical protein